jgi:hypothetical protein
MIRIEFEIDNAAFADNWQGEIRHILSQVARELGDCDQDNVVDVDVRLRDSNGNTVGKVVGK